MGQAFLQEGLQPFVPRGKLEEEPAFVVIHGAGIPHGHSYYVQLGCGLACSKSILETEKKRVNANFFLSSTAHSAEI